MRLHDTLTRSLCDLPAPPGPIRMYVCGSTVYQHVHVGNSRPFVIAMWLRSWLRLGGYEVTLVHNITDVDDKVYAEALRQGIGSRELSARATEWFLDDTDHLGLGRPDRRAARDGVDPEIVAFIEELVASDHAYVASGDVYFAVSSSPDYGRLSGARLEDMASQETSLLKRDPCDFAEARQQRRRGALLVNCRPAPSAPHMALQVGKLQIDELTGPAPAPAASRPRQPVVIWDERGCMFLSRSKEMN